MIEMHEISDPVIDLPGAPKIVVRRTCVGDAVDAAALNWADRPGWNFDDGQGDLTFAEMRQCPDAAARALIAMGVGRGDVVATLMPNRPEFAFLMFACAKVGAVLCPLNTRSKSFELRHGLSHGQVKLLVMVDRFLKLDFTATLAEVTVGAEWTGQGTIVARDLPELMRVVSLTGEGGHGTDALGWGAFLAAGEAVPITELAAAQAARSWREPLILQYTSGTTSLPKGALCDHRYVLFFGVEYLMRAGLRGDDTLLNTQPFYHNGGSCGALTVPLSLGCRMVTAEYYDAATMLRLIEEERPAIRTGYGAMYVMEMALLEFERRDLSSLRGGWCVGTPALMNKVRERMGIEGLVQIYGSTEGSGTGGFADEPWTLRAETCGRALTGMEIGIFRPDGNERLPPGEVGEVRISGWLQMSGYHRQPEATAAAFCPPGWLRTGDLGTLDTQGNLRFMGRVKDMLKIGGENVSAEEVESLLLGHPDIVQVAVIGRTDDRLGEVVMAIVETRPGAQIDEVAVIDWSRERMANFRVPRRVSFVSGWPMTDSGKIKKAELRKLYAGEMES